ncbi:MAG: DNA protein [Pseudomonadota bacterium]|nr:DNA protein [Pseudomonadota bacterium]
MTANALVQARIDRAVKEEATIVLSAMGLTVSDAVRLMLTKIAREHTLPFNPLIPNQETVEAMKEARRGNLPSAATIEQFLDAMNAQD